MAVTYLSAAATLVGSAIGAVSVLASAWFTQQRQDRAQQVSQDKARRADLYKRFIDESSRLYAEALIHNEAEIPELISIYGLISQMQVVSSRPVVEEAEEVVRIIIDTFSAPNKTFPELKNAMSEITQNIRCEPSATNAALNCRVSRLPEKQRSGLHAGAGGLWARNQIAWAKRRCRQTNHGSVRLDLRAIVRGTPNRQIELVKRQAA